MPFDEEPYLSPSKEVLTMAKLYEINNLQHVLYDIHLRITLIKAVFTISLYMFLQLKMYTLRDNDNHVIHKVFLLLYFLGFFHLSLIE